MRQMLQHIRAKVGALRVTMIQVVRLRVAAWSAQDVGFAPLHLRHPRMHRVHTVPQICRQSVLRIRPQ